MKFVKEFEVGSLYILYDLDNIDTMARTENDVIHIESGEPLLFLRLLKTTSMHFYAKFLYKNMVVKINFPCGNEATYGLLPIDKS